MQPSQAKTLCRTILSRRNQFQPAVSSSSAPPPFKPPRHGAVLVPTPRYDVFINHRGADTKRTVAGMLYEHLTRHFGLRAFLDSKNMKPGDKLFDHIDPAIRNCRLGIAVFSQHYCDSYFCLHELSLMMETRRRVIPVFCDVKPSELRVIDDGTCRPEDLRRFELALEEAKYTVGLTFDSTTGDWAEFLRTATDAVAQNLVQVERDDRRPRWHRLKRK